MHPTRTEDGPSSCLTTACVNQEKKEQRVLKTEYEDVKAHSDVSLPEDLGDDYLLSTNFTVCPDLARLS